MKQRSTTNQFGAKLSRGILALVIAGFGLFAVTRAASAETLSEKIANLQSQIDQNQAEANRLSGEADNLQNALNILNAEKNAIQLKIDLNQAKSDQLTAQIEENQKKLEKQQAVLSETVSDLSVESTVSPIELLAGSPSIGDFIDRQEYRSSVQEQVENAIATVKKLKAQLAEQQKEIETILAEQKVQRDQLAAKEAEQAQLLAATQAQEAQYNALVGNLAQQKAEAEAALAASMVKRSYAVAPSGYVSAGSVVGRVGSTGQSTGPHLHLEIRDSGGGRHDPSGYIRSTPVDMPPAYISQYYGEKDCSQYRGDCSHPGTDYAAYSGAPIYAIDSGMLFSGYGIVGSAYGCAAVIEHSNGFRSIYGHMSSC